MSVTTTPPSPADFASGTALRSPSTRESQKTELRAASIALVVGILLLAVKFVAYGLTGSAAVFSDALESVVNVIAGCIALWAVFLAHRPPDSTHPYGHGKVEFISAALEGAMILVAAIAAIVKAMDVLLRGQGPATTRLEAGFILMAAALVANGVVGAALLRLGKRNNSAALEADGKHLLADVVTSVVAVAALAAVKWTGRGWIDPVAALLVSVWVAATGIGLIRRSVSGLMDETDAADDALLRKILDNHLPGGSATPTICSYHKLRHRHNGRYHWVDFHIMVPSDLDIQKGHEIASEIEYEIETALGEGNATAHVEPCDPTRCTRCGKAVQGRIDR